MQSPNINSWNQEAVDDDDWEIDDSLMPDVSDVMKHVSTVGAVSVCDKQICEKPTHRELPFETYFRVDLRTWEAPTENSKEVVYTKVKLS